MDEGETDAGEHGTTRPRVLSVHPLTRALLSVQPETQRGMRRANPTEASLCSGFLLS